MEALPRVLLAALCWLAAARGALIHQDDRCSACSAAIEQLLLQLSEQVQAVEGRLIQQTKQMEDMERRLNQKIEHVDTGRNDALLHNSAELDPQKLPNVDFRIAPKVVSAVPPTGTPLDLTAGLHRDPSPANVRNFSPIAQMALDFATGPEHASGLRRVLQSGANPNARDSRGDTALHAAARTGNVEAVDALLRAGADPTARGNLLRSPLHVAAAGGHLAVAERLLRAGAPLDGRDALGATAGALAADGHHSAVFEFLLLENVTAPYEDAEGDSPLLAAVRQGRWEWARKLAERGAPCALPGRDGTSALLVAAREGRGDVVDAMLRGGTAPPPVAEMRRALDVAGSADVVWALAQAAPHLLAGAAGRAALRSAARDGRHETLGALLNSGVDLYHREEGVSTLEIAAMMGRGKCVVALLQHHRSEEDLLLGVGQVLNGINTPTVIRALGDVIPNVLPMEVIEKYLRLVKTSGICDFLDTLLTVLADVEQKDRAKEISVEFASEEGDVDCVTHILKLESRNETKSAQALRALGATRSPEIVRSISSTVPEVLRLTSGAEALRRAANEGRCEIMEALLVAGVNATLQDDSGNSALDIAVKKGNAGCVVPLLKRGSGDPLEADVERALRLAEKGVVVKIIAEIAPGVLRGAVGGAVLMSAAADGKCEVVAALLDGGASALGVDDAGKSALERAAEGGHAACASSLRARGAGMLSGPQWEEVLRKAAESSSKDKVAALLAAGVDPNAKNSKGYSALAMAAEKSCLLCIEVLVKGGASKESVITSFHNSTILIRAVANNNLEVVRALLNAGANVHGIDGNRNNALVWAAFNCKDEAVRTLVGAGARINSQVNGWYPLHYAAHKGCEDSTKLLLESGANVEAKTTGNDSALTLAAFNGHLGAVRVLLAAGANVESKNGDGSSSLLLAARKGYTEVVKLLLTKGANIANKNNEGQTALSVATKEEIRQLLRS